ncbi:winged helix-turn-helix transcriptional regulator [Sporocytophaga myxococcoides]|uniref:winged helix-turn-helix transcriptional regulator n=1 Tax=Sporocytophaga myxococcoides TaxID=153721 RepID=UPI000491C4D1|nr:helix-turn-helix domain-containing protein [Sporocytophaga myxococcoides]
MDYKFRSNCPISSVLDIIGDKWSLLILRDLMFAGKKTFGEFSSSTEKIATNILTDRLQTLEQTGLITKGKLPDNKKTNIYKLTEKGIDFLPILVEVMLWSNKHLNDHVSEENQKVAAMIQKDKEAFIKGMRSRLASS